MTHLFITPTPLWCRNEVYATNFIDGTQELVTYISSITKSSGSERRSVIVVFSLLLVEVFQFTERQGLVSNLKKQPINRVVEKKPKH